MVFTFTDEIKVIFVKDTMEEIIKRIAHRACADDVGLLSQNTESKCVGIH